jgi:ribosomal protein S18
MKQLIFSISLFSSMVISAQNVASDSTYFVVEGGKTFQVDVINYSNGAQDLKKREVLDLSSDLNARVLAQTDRWTDFYNRTTGIDEKLQKFIRENNRIANQTTTDLFATNQLAMQDALIGSYALADYDRSTTMAFALNASNVLRFSGTGVGTGQVVCLTPTTIYLRNWRGSGLLLFTSNNGATWSSLNRKLTLTKQ